MRQYYAEINNEGLYLNLHLLDSHPQIEVDGEMINDPSYISEPIPSNVYVSEEFPPKWTGSKWIETVTPPEPEPQPPSELDILMLAVAELAELVAGGA